MKKRRKLPLTCPSCKGRGTVLYTFPPQTLKGKPLTVRRICPVCEGYGVIEEKPR